MRATRSVGLGVLAYLLLGATNPARATINITGHWVPELNFFGTLFSETWDITQTGTALTQTPSSSGQSGPRTGMIDSTSGAFTLSDPQSCFPATGPESCTFSGTAAADGLTFTGTLNCSAPTLTECGDGPASVTAVRAPTTCGNGLVDTGEQCDDGAANGMPGSCCLLACQFVPQGTPCDAPANVCIIHDVCDGAGGCVPGGAPLACDDCSTCDPATSACVPGPATVCRAPTVFGAARILMKTSGPLLRWKWSKGQATALADFGDPVGTDTYSLCVYDESVGGGPTTRLKLVVPPGSRWRAKPTGFVYKDKSGTMGGITSITLKAGALGKRKVAVNASGANLTLPALPLVVPVMIQLRSHGLCWGAGYESAGTKKATTSVFLATSSPSGAFLASDLASASASSSHP